jgi:hypothetical protein
MKMYTGTEYVRIAIANAAGFEKSMPDNETKILWTMTTDLDEYITLAKNPMAYLDAVQALRDAENGVPSGFICGMDAGSSGVQMLAVLTGDLVAAVSTGLARVDGRGNFYQDVENTVDAELEIDPEDLKQAVMTAFYMSEKVPEDVFGEENMHFFNEALSTCAPYCFELLQMVKELHPELDKTAYEWDMPNGYHVYTPIIVTDKLTTIEMLGGNFKYETKSITEDPKYKGLLANIAHSTDAFVSDEVGDRTGYNRDILMNGLVVIERALANWKGDACTNTVPSIRWINDMGLGKYHTISEVRKQFTLGQLQALKELAIDVMKWNSFPNFARHDEFCSYPVAMNEIRYHYQTVMSQIASSTLLSDILSSICDEEITIDKVDISAEVLAGNYGLN